MAMNGATTKARYLARTMDTTARPGAEFLHDHMTTMRSEANAEGASTETLTAIDDALAEFEAIWDPAASGSYSRGHELTAEAIKAVAEEFGEQAGVYQWYKEIGRA